MSVAKGQFHQKKGHFSKRGFGAPNLVVKKQANTNVPKLDDSYLPNNSYKIMKPTQQELKLYVEQLSKLIEKITSESKQKRIAEQREKKINSLL